MTGTPRDRELGDAQKEIQRRLLRQEKLKRIEAEEMRRLAATSWKPPIERITPTAGPTVQDAADAIEETERWRSAYGQEAQLRAEARQNDPLATRDDPGVPDPAQVITPRVDPFTLEPNEPARLEKSLAAGDFIAIVSVKGIPTRQHPISPDSRTNVTVAVNVDRRQRGSEVIEDALGVDNDVISEGVSFKVRADGYLHPVEVVILNASSFSVKIEIEIREQKGI
jgi:hypothetical protein